MAIPRLRSGWSCATSKDHGPAASVQPPRLRGPRAAGSRGPSARRLRPSLDLARDGPAHRRRATARHRSLIPRETIAQPVGQRQDPLADQSAGKTWSTRCAARSAMRRPPSLDLARDGPELRRRAAARTTRSCLAQEGNQPVEAAGRAPKPREAGRETTVGATGRSPLHPPTAAGLRRCAGRRLARGRSQSDRGPLGTARPARASATDMPPLDRPHRAQAHTGCHAA